MNAPSLFPRAACDATTGAHRLRFLSFYDCGRDVSIPCDEDGNVDMNTLTERLRNTYLGARAMVGREYACPTVQIETGLDDREPLLPLWAA